MTTDSEKPTRDTAPVPTVHRTEAERILRRQSNRCAACGRRLGAYCEEIDYIIPLDRGGSRTARNMQVLCPPCHRIKAEKDRTLAASRRGER
ncbi:MAG: endonuclease [Euryarchaeota archaeon]|nr:endonuclease [Euryarchaeota archaeon]MDN5339794.1 endonuclease [Euryarchaeota archaeon]